MFYSDAGNKSSAQSSTKYFYEGLKSFPYNFVFFLLYLKVCIKLFPPVRKALQLHRDTCEICFFLTSYILHSSFAAGCW